MKITATLEKLKTTHDQVVKYTWNIGTEEIVLNDFLGKKIHLQFSGQINCVHCSRKVKKTFNQGYCFPCSQKLAECDICIVKPELCHFHKGTCRDEQWGKDHCMQPHVVYLANSSGLKVGITRKKNVPFRWMDQGAYQALPVLEVSNRLNSGKVETLIKEFANDKTHWQKMLKGDPEELDLQYCWQDIKSKLDFDYLSSFIEKELDEEVEYFEYPVLEYPQKIKSINLLKQNEVEAVLMGIKGQYLIFENSVLNVRSHAGFKVDWEVL